MKGQLRIDSLFAFVVVDDDGTEGVPAVMGPDGIAMPLMGADLAMVKILEPRAQEVADSTGKEVTLVHFSVRTEQKKYTVRPEANRQSCGCYTAPEGYKVLCKKHWTEAKMRGG